MAFPQSPRGLEDVIDTMGTRRRIPMNEAGVNSFKIADAS